MTPHVLQFLRRGQVWQSRESGARIRVMKIIGRSVVVASLGKVRRRFVLDCSKFRNWYHGYQFTENPDGTPATEVPPDPPRCWRCGSWLHAEGNCDASAADVAEEARRRRK